jgi:hypothetical protein
MNMLPEIKKPLCGRVSFIPGSAPDISYAKGSQTRDLECQIHFFDNDFLRLYKENEYDLLIPKNHVASIDLKKSHEQQDASQKEFRIPRRPTKNYKE